MSEVKGESSISESAGCLSNANESPLPPCEDPKLVFTSTVEEEPKNVTNSDLEDKVCKIIKGSEYVDSGGDTNRLLMKRGSS